MTEIRTLAQFMADDAARAPQEEPLDIPPDEMERIVHEMLTREYTKTLDEAVPALGQQDATRSGPHEGWADRKWPTGSNI
jgi:hypothetical protein